MVTLTAGWTLTTATRPLAYKLDIQPIRGGQSTSESGLWFTRSTSPTRMVKLMVRHQPDSRSTYCYRSLYTLALTTACVTYFQAYVTPLLLIDLHCRQIQLSTQLNSIY